MNGSQRRDGGRRDEARAMSSRGRWLGRKYQSKGERGSCKVKERQENIQRG